MHRYLLKTCKYYMKSPEKWWHISVHVETSVMYYFNIKDNFIVTVDNQFQFIVKKENTDAEENVNFVISFFVFHCKILSLQMSAIVLLNIQ